MDITVTNEGASLTVEAAGRTFIYVMPGQPEATICTICGVALHLHWVAKHTAWHIATWTTQTPPVETVRYQTKGFGTHGDD